MNRLRGYSLLEHDLKLDELNKMVVDDPDPDKRNLFSILQSHAILLSRITLALEETINNNAVKVSDHEVRIKKHDDVVLQGKTALTIMSSLQAAVIGFFMYGYSTFADMRDQVGKQSVLLPRIENMAMEARQQRQIIDATSDHVQQQRESNIQRDVKIDSIDNDVVEIQHKKVIKASKSFK